MVKKKNEEDWAYISLWDKIFINEQKMEYSLAYHVRCVTGLIFPVYFHRFIAALVVIVGLALLIAAWVGR